MDLRLGILISENFDQANSAWDKHEQKVASATKKMSGHYDMYRAGALHSIKTIAEYHLQWDGKTTAQLTKHIKELQDKRVDEQLAVAKAVATADAVQTRIHKNRLEQITLESRALKQLSIERTEVQHRGAGAIIGQLGIGRSLSGPTHLLEGFGDMTSLAKGVAIGAAVYESAKLAYEALAKLHDLASEWEKSEDRLHIAMTRTGLSLQDRNRLVELMQGDVLELSKSFSKSRMEISETMATVAAYSRTGGDTLKHLTELSIGVAEATGRGIEEVAQFIGKGANPEIEAQLSRLGIRVEKNMTQAERVKALTAAYGDTIEEVKRRQESGVHAWDRTTQAVKDTAAEYSAKIFKEITPIIKDIQTPVSDLAHIFGFVLVGSVHTAVEILRWGKNEIESFVPTIKAAMNLLGLTSAPTEEDMVAKKWEKAIAAGWEAYNKGYEEWQKKELSAKIKVPPVPVDPGARSKAFNEEEDRLREHFAKILDIYVDEGHTLEQIKLKQAQLDLKLDEAVYAAAVKYAQHTGGLRYKIFQDKQQLQQVISAEDEQLAQEYIAREKATSEKRTAIISKTYTDERTVELKSYEEKRSLLISLRDFNAAWYGIESKEKLSFDLQIEQEDDRHFDVLRKNTEDDLKHHTEALMKFYELEFDLRKKNSEDALKKSQEQSDMLRSVLESGFDPLNEKIREIGQSAKESGSFVIQMLASMEQAFLQAASKKLFEKIFSFGDEKSSGGFSPEKFGTMERGIRAQTGMENFNGPIDLRAFLESLGVMSFKDSPVPLGQTGTFMLGGKAVVMADPLDYLIKIPLGVGGKQPNLIGSHGGIDTLTRASMPAESTKGPNINIPQGQEITLHLRVDPKPAKSPFEGAKYDITGKDFVPQTELTERQRSEMARQQDRAFGGKTEMSLLDDPTFFAASLPAAIGKEIIQKSFAEVTSDVLKESFMKGARHALEEKLSPLAIGREEGIKYGLEKVQGENSGVGNSVSDIPSNISLAASEKASVALNKLATNSDVASKSLGTDLPATVAGLFQNLPGMGGGGDSFLGGLFKIGSMFAGLPGFAGGTDSAPGGAAWVGEDGPELRILPRGTRIIPNHKISVHAGNAGGVDTDRIVSAIQGIPRTSILNTRKTRLSELQDIREERYRA